MSDDLNPKPAGGEPAGWVWWGLGELKDHPHSITQTPPMSTAALIEDCLSLIEADDLEFNRPFSKLVELDAFWPDCDALADLILAEIRIEQGDPETLGDAYIQWFDAHMRYFYGGSADVT